MQLGFMSRKSKFSIDLPQLAQCGLGLCVYFLVPFAQKQPRSMPGARRQLTKHSFHPPPAYANKFQSSVYPETNGSMNHKLSRPLQDPLFAAAKKGDPAERPPTGTRMQPRVQERIDFNYCNFFTVLPNTCRN